MQGCSYPLVNMCSARVGGGERVIRILVIDSVTYMYCAVKSKTAALQLVLHCSD